MKAFFQGFEKKGREGSFLGDFAGGVVEGSQGTSRRRRFVG